MASTPNLLTAEEHDALAWIDTLTHDQDFAKPKRSRKRHDRSDGDEDDNAPSGKKSKARANHSVKEPASDSTLVGIRRTLPRRAQTASDRDQKPFTSFTPQLSSTAPATHQSSTSTARQSSPVIPLLDQQSFPGKLATLQFESFVAAANRRLPVDFKHAGCRGGEHRCTDGKVSYGRTTPSIGLPGPSQSQDQVWNTHTFARGEATVKQVRYVISQCTCTNAQIFENMWRRYKRKQARKNKPVILVKEEYLAGKKVKWLNEAVGAVCPSKNPFCGTVDLTGED